MNLVTSRLEALLNGWRWRAKFILNLSTLDPWRVIVIFIVWDDEGGDDDVIDDYGDDEEFAWYSHWLGISVLNRRSNPIPSKLVLPLCLIVQPPTNMVFRVN